MTIRVGERIPNITIATMTPNGPAEITTDEIFAGKKVVLFAVPGAYTPTCSANHLPGYVRHRDAFADKGIDAVACLSVNDAFVMGAWGEAHGVGDGDAGGILMLADGSGAFTEALGLQLDLTANHLGVRSRRYAMVVEDGVITHLNVEEGAEFKVSSAESVLALL